MNPVRQKRVEKQILRLLAELYFKELKDPRVGFVTFTKCVISPDGRNAKVYVSIFEEGKQKTDTFKALIHAKGFLQSRVGKALGISSVPLLSFFIDDSLEKAAHIDKLLEE